MIGAGHPFAPPSHEQRWIDTATELAAEFAKTAAEFDESAQLPLANLQALHGSGLDVALLPSEYGGASLSYRSFGAIVRLFGAACPSTACVWVMHIGAAAGLVTRSTPDVARFYADGLIAGRRFANALSEPTGGNLFLMPLQHAVPVSGGYQLTGAKRFASGCEIADHFLINALVDGKPAFFGLAADPSTMAYIPIWDTMGLRASRSQLIEFTGTLLRADRLCPPSTGSHPNHIGAGLAFLSLGIADAAFAALVAHARKRVIPTTGKPLAEMQWLRFEAADVHTRLEAAGMYAHHMCWLADQNSADFIAATMRAKQLSNVIAVDAAQLAVRVGGASAGYMRPSPIERLFRDAQAGGLMAYSVEVCKDTIGAELLTE